MAKRLFSTNQISDIEARLRSLPKVEQKQRDLNKSEAIRTLANAIRTAQKNGYSLADIASQLTGWDMEISGTTLKNYLQRIGRTSKRPREQLDKSAKQESRPVGNSIGNS
jgi:hypothetical protein